MQRILEQLFHLQTELVLKLKTEKRGQRQPGTEFVPGCATETSLLGLFS